MAKGTPSAISTTGISRRRVLKTGLKTALGGAGLAMGPWIVRDAFSSSGSLNILMLSDYLPTHVTKRFTKKTGIKINLDSFGSNEELKVRLKSTRGRGFDLVSPPGQSALQWRALGLLQPIDLLRVPLARLIPEHLRVSTENWTWDGGLYHLPYLWGTEGLAWRTDRWSPDADGPSYGDFWRPEMKGAIMGRAHSMMLGIGIWMDATGKFSSNRMHDAYKDEDGARRVWSKIMKFATEHRAWIKVFWDDAAEQRSGFLQNNVTLGQTLDGQPFEMRKEGQPIAFRAPKEGALGWIDGLSIPQGASNIEQIYAFLDYIYQPAVAASISAEIGHSPVVVGAVERLPKEVQAAMSAAYPGDALERLWWWPPEPLWYTDIRNEYRDRFIAAS